MRRPLTLVVLTFASLALADVTLVNETTTGGKKRTVTLSQKGDLAWFEIAEDGQPARTMLRDMKAKKLFIIDPVKKVVLEMTEADSKAMEARQEQFRAQMKAQLEHMSPEQRARVESTMMGQLDGKKPVFTFKKTGAAARKVNGFTCTDYTMLRDGEASGEACFMPWKDSGLTSEQFKTLMVQALPSSAAMSGPAGQGIDAAAAAPGFPVARTTRNDKGEVVAQMELKSLAKTPVSADHFELPKDYERKSMSELMNKAPPPRPPPGAAPSPATK